MEKLLSKLPPKLYVWIYRQGLNFWPCLSRTGGKVTYISEDFRKLIVTLKLNWKTLNKVGTIFGGSMYASTDPYYMLMLMQILGKDYVVWDKGCTIRFKKPSKETITAEFIITDEMLKTVKVQVDQKGYHTFTWPLSFKNKEGTVFVEFDKVLYVATKESYKNRLKVKQPQVG